MTDDALPLDELIAALLRPEAYPEPPARVELVQTHISLVFLAGERVYKVKKPLDLGFLDFSTLAKRRYYCGEELRLNRRLCADTYLGVVPIRATPEGLRVGARHGAVVDYAVVMRRLPQERMLDTLIARGEAGADALDAVADTLATFHAGSATSAAIARYGSERVIRRNWDENFAQTQPYAGDTISPTALAFAHAWVQAWQTRLAPVFRARAAAGRVRDCHGDLRASAVCLLDDGICIYDCIEFNPRIRYSDVASDVAFLAMDLDARGRPDLAERFVQRYVDHSRDEGVPAVLDFYRCYRAWVRGKVESFRSSEPEVAEAQRAEARAVARQHFALAVGYAARSLPPLLLITCGLSGTGKSALAAALGAERACEVIASDVVRKELAGIAPTERGAAGAYEAGIYTRAFSERTYRELFRRGRAALQAGRSVILDATFPTRRWREQAARIAAEEGALFLCVEARAPEAAVRARLLARANDPAAISDATWEVHERQRATFEPVDELDDWAHVVVDTGGSLPDSIDAARQALEARLSPVV